MVNKILQKINSDLKLDLKIENDIIKKETARSLKKYILVGNDKKKYLLEIASDLVENFYLQRTIKSQEEFEKINFDFSLNKPIVYEIGNNYSYALYLYFDNSQEIDSNEPIELLENFYKRVAISVEINNETVDKILDNFISAWPHKYHNFIKRQKGFNLYKELLFKYTQISVSFEHGDYTKNNILSINNQFYLMDFEFYREFQPIGFDIYDFNQSIKKDGNEDYFELHQVKYNLINTINYAIDNNLTSHQIYNDFEDKILLDNWEKLYSKGANYNLSLLWCKTWCKYYLKDRELFIFTIWNDSDLVLLLPLYRKKRTLLLIGSDPDLFDSFDILYSEEKYINQFFHYIRTSRLNLDFRYIDSETQFAKLVIKYLYQNDIKYDSKIIDTKPKTVLDKFNPKTKERSDITRLKNRAVKNFGNELVFEYQCSKSIKQIDEFIGIHKERWVGGPFISLDNFEEFIKDISQTELVLLSKLSIDDNAVAYHFAYKDSNGNLNSAIPSYAKLYDTISPGKVLLYDLIRHSKEDKFIEFDFGRGAESYKYWFSTEAHVLFHLKIDIRDNVIVKSKRLINKILNKLERMIYG